jgi:hypothetical protein
MYFTKTISLAFLGAVLLFTACKKDDDDGGSSPPEQTCRVMKAVYFDSTGARGDSINYTYTGDKITKATFSDGYFYNFEYAGDKVSKRSGFGAGTNTAEYYQQITYRTDGSIEKIETFIDTLGTGSNYLLYERYEYTNASGKISKIGWFVPLFTQNVVAEYAYTFTGNNVSGITISDLTSSPATTSNLTYTYDANPNYYKKQNAQIHFIDILFGDADPTLFPLAISENNVTGVASAGGSTAISYTLDSRQNLRVLNVGGAPFVEYTYQCQ